MSVFQSVVLVLHFLGLAAVIGSFLAQLDRRSAFATRWMVIGLVTQLVTGLALMGFIDAGTSGGANHVKLGVKLAIAVVALVLTSMAASRQRRADAGIASAVAAGAGAGAGAGTGSAGGALPFLHSAGALAIGNVVIAVLWH